MDVLSFWEMPDFGYVQIHLKILSALKEGMLHFLLPFELRVVNFRSEWQPCQMATLKESMPYSCV